MVRIMVRTGYYSFLLMLAVVVVVISTECPSGCLTCDGNSGHCTNCNTTYYLDDKMCVKCAETCLDCTGSGYDMCSRCAIGFYLNETVCIPCTEESHCLSCETATDCHFCVDGFYTLANGNGYHSCVHCPDHCKQCNTVSVCLECNPGYYGNTCEHECGLCVNSSCLKAQCNHGCIDNYYTYTGSSEPYCIKCKPGCRLCDGPFGCTLCADNYYKGGSVCLQCMDNCLTCSDKISCDACITGKWGSDCTNTDVTATCLPVCENKKYCLNGICAPCPSNCSTDQCNPLNGSCDTCLNGFWGLQCNNICHAGCSSSCYKDTGFCNQCKMGYSGNECDTRCNTNCVDPKNDSAICRTNGECKFGCKLGFKGKQCRLSLKSDTEDHSSLQEDDEQPIGVIAGAAGGGFVVIVSICIVVFVCKKRSKSKAADNTSEGFPVEVTPEANSEQGYIYAVPNKLKKTNTLPIQTEASNNKPPIPLRLSHLEDQGTDVDNVHIEEEIDDDEPGSSVIVNEQLDPTGDTYYNVAGLKRSRININSLSEYVAKKTETEFDKEFQKFPKGLARPFTESRKPENISHNRYRAIYPYDATRVILRDGGSNYINASYIDGYNQPKAYIASLGPTRATMDTFTLFWRMVWQEKVEKIAMLTNIVEGDKMKCEQYWPDVGNTERYGDVIVTCESDDIYAYFCVRRFSVSKSKDKRELHHLHFTAWPDRSVPDDVTCLIEFRQKVENIRTFLGGPLVVHCSAGVGRTGTYIGLDMLAKEGKTEGTVDIFGCVMGMRGQRISMVQTLEQYRYLHDAVVHALTLDCDAISLDTFHIADRNKLQQQFKKINEMKERHFNDDDSAVKRNAKIKDKHRKGADIPGDMHRVVLHGGTEYINAVYINSYKSQNRYILAQTPLSGTVEDFLYMILQENVTCIVTMDEDNVKNKTVGVYLPAANQTLKKGSLQIKAVMCESTSSYTLRKLTITNLKENNIQERTVYHFQMNSWKQTENSPSDTNAFVELIKDVERTANATDVTSSIIVHCLTGAERSALFCVVSILTEKMNVDNVTSVVNTVRQIRSRRTAAIPNLDQYIFCHQCVSTYLKSCNTYSNVI